MKIKLGRVILLILEYRWYSAGVAVSHISVGKCMVQCHIHLAAPGHSQQILRQQLDAKQGCEDYYCRTQGTFIFELY